MWRLLGQVVEVCGVWVISLPVLLVFVPTCVCAVAERWKDDDELLGIREGISEV